MLLWILHHLAEQRRAVPRAEQPGRRHALLCDDERVQGPEVIAEVAAGHEEGLRLRRRRLRGGLCSGVFKERREREKSKKSKRAKRRRERRDEEPKRERRRAGESAWVRFVRHTERSIYLIASVCLRSRCCETIVIIEREEIRSRRGDSLEERGRGAHY